VTARERTALGARLAERVQGTPLAVRLALLSAALTVVVVGTAFLVLRLRAAADARQVFAGELAASAHALQQLQDDRQLLLLATANLASTSPTLRAALQTARLEATPSGHPREAVVATVRREAVRIFGDVNRDLLIVTDDRGRVIAAVARHGREPAPGDNLSRLPAVQHVLAADTPTPDSSFGLVRAGERLHQVGCVAILVQGQPIGVLVLGDGLDGMLTGIRTASAAGLVVTAGDDVVATSAGAPPVTAPALESDAGAPQGGRRVRVGGEEYVAASLSLGRMEDGRPARLHMLRSISAAVRPLTGSLGRSFLLAGALAVLAVGVGTLGLSRAALRPLSRFVDVLRSGADGRQPARVAPARGPREMRTLATAYNRLIDSVERQHRQLEQRRTELVAANETLRSEIQERERAEQALRQSEAQLRQAQKLEALGTLAGGVAHDFNNLLTVIMGYTDLVTHALPPTGAMRDDVAQIKEAAQRATTLVRQLLAFSRKQVLQLRIVDLNDVVTGLEPLLRRLIGADIDLQVRLAPQLQRVKADAGQMEQVVMNLVVNARDAMPGGGTLVIETGDVTLDRRHQHRPDALPGGPAVMLAVSDTGTGMDEATRARIFEPFFTTKAPGEGTGLGLSTVHGVVHQTGGSITVFSELGKGTRFRIYLPPVGETTRETPSTAASSEPQRGTETVLVAEDDAQVRRLVTRSLEELGYRVLEAEDGAAALETAAQHDGPIHLLVTDVVMPRMGGPALLASLREARPDVEVLFLSGYSTDAVARHGELAPNAAFLHKPVSAEALALTVRRLLDGKPLPVPEP